MQIFVETILNPYLASSTSIDFFADSASEVLRDLVKFFIVTNYYLLLFICSSIPLRLISTLLIVCNLLDDSYQLVSKENLKHS